MKLVLFSDLHLDSHFAWLGSSQQAARTRRQALRETLLRICDLVSEVKADALLCGGDLYEHERVSMDTAQFLRAAFAHLDPIPVYLAPGNHDWFGPQSLYYRLAWSPNVHVFHGDRLEPITVANGLTLWGAAHCAPANTDGLLDHFRVDRGGVHLALFHGSEQGWFSEQGEGKLAPAPFSAEQIEHAGLHHALLGHYHRPRDASRHTYPGNPDPLSFGEDGERGAVEFSVHADGTVTRVRHRVSMSMVHDVQVDVGGCTSQQEVRQRLAGKLAGLSGAVRVTLHGELGTDIDLLPRDLAPVAPELEGLVVQVGNVRVGYDFDAIAQEPTVRGEFVRDVRGADLSDEERRRVLVTGLRALEGRTDLEVL